MKNSQIAPMFFTPSSTEVVNGDYDYVINSDTTLGWSRYWNANPVPSSPLADDIATAQLGPVAWLDHHLFISTVEFTVRNMICLETPKWLPIVYWVVPMFNLPVALLHWSDVNLGTIALPTVSLCSIFESLLRWGFYAPPTEGSACKVTELLWGLRFCISVQTLTIAMFLQIRHYF